MAQKIWKINPDSPLQRIVGIYHGEESGHLVIYVDQSILCIKFEQKENKSYSFYLDNLLYEVKMECNENEENSYSYELINRSKELEEDYVKSLSWKEKIRYWFKE